MNKFEAFLLGSAITMIVLGLMVTQYCTSVGGYYICAFKAGLPW